MHEHEVEVVWYGSLRDFARAVCVCGQRRSGRLMSVRRWAKRHVDGH